MTGYGMGDGVRLPEIGFSLKHLVYTVSGDYELS
jgi:hypothetical protein